MFAGNGRGFGENRGFCTGQRQYLQGLEARTDEGGLIVGYGVWFCGRSAGMWGSSRARRGMAGGIGKELKWDKPE